MGVPKTSDPIPIKIKMPNSSMDLQAFSKEPNQDFIDTDVLGIFKLKREGKN